MKKLISLFLTFLALTAFTPKKQAKCTIFMIGDSTMANKKTKVFPETGWGQALPVYVDTSKIRIDNHAQNGRSTKSFIDDGLWEAVISQVKTGDYVFIQFGHNDEKAHKPKVYARAETSYKLNLERFIKETRAKGGNPVLFTSIVRRDFEETGVLRPTHGTYPAIVKQVGAEQNVPVIDLEAKTKLLVEGAGIEGSLNFYLHPIVGDYANYPKGKVDDTHLSRKGAIAIAGLAVECIKKQVPELRECF